jgi:DNA-binding NarL/FixJ family response regulator
VSRPAHPLRTGSCSPTITEIVRAGLQALLDAEPGFEVVAQVRDVTSALGCVRTHHPDVLGLDLNMPGGSALDAITGNPSRHAPDAHSHLDHA